MTVLGKKRPRCAWCHRRLRRSVHYRAHGAARCIVLHMRSPARTLVLFVVLWSIAVVILALGWDAWTTVVRPSLTHYHAGRVQNNWSEFVRHSLESRPFEHGTSVEVLIAASVVALLTIWWLHDRRERRFRGVRIVGQWPPPTHQQTGQPRAHVHVPDEGVYRRLAQRHVIDRHDPEPTGIAPPRK